MDAVDAATADVVPEAAAAVKTTVFYKRSCSLMRKLALVRVRSSDITSRITVA